MLTYNFLRTFQIYFFYTQLVKHLHKLILVFSFTQYSTFPAFSPSANYFLNSLTILLDTMKLWHCNPQIQNTENTPTPAIFFLVSDSCKCIDRNSVPTFIWTCVLTGLLLCAILPNILPALQPCLLSFTCLSSANTLWTLEETRG